MSRVENCKGCLRLGDLRGATARIGRFTLAAALSSQIAFATPREPFQDRLFERVNVGDEDSARVLVQQERFLTREALEPLLSAHARHLTAQRPDSAEFWWRTARVIANLYADVYGDSLCLRVLALHEELPRENLPTVGAGWTHYREAHRLNQISEWKRARDLATEASALAREAGDLYLEGRAELLLGMCSFNLSRFDEARTHYERALIVARQLDDRVYQARILRNIATTFQSQGYLSEALESLRSVLDLARRSEDWELCAATLNSLGVNFWERGELDSAQLRLADGLAVSRERGFPKFETALLVNLGGVLRELGEYEESATCQEEVIRIARGAGSAYRRQELWALTNLASVCAEMGRFSRALALLREALPIAQEAGALDVTAALRQEIGNLYLELNRPDEALRHFQETLPMLRELGIVEDEAVTHRLMGRVYAKLGRSAEARQAFEEAVRITERLDNRLALATALCDLGWMLTGSGDPDRAETCLLQARSVADTLGNPFVQGMVELNLAEAYTTQGEYKRALPLLDRAIERGRVLHLQPLLLESLVQKARAVRSTGAWGEADGLLAEALEIVESVRGRQTGEEVRLGYLTNKKAIYVDRIRVLYELGGEEEPGGAAHEEAFAVAERARARSLLDALAAGGADPGMGVDARLRKRERLLTVRLGSIQSELLEAASSEEWEPARIDSLHALLEQTAREYRVVAEEISGSCPAFGALSGYRPALSVAEVQRRILAPDQVLLEFVTGDDESYVFSVGSDRFRLQRIPIGADALRARVEQFRAVLLSDAFATAEFAALSRDLFDILLRPVLAGLSPGVRLLIVPDGPLFYLPFAVLDSGSEVVVERHPITCVPSASVLDPALQKTGRSGGPSLLAVGNPTSLRSEVLLASVRGAERWRFGELPYSGQEVRRVGEYFARATVLTEREATEEAVKARMGEVTHLHFATHGLLDENEPLLSGLALAHDEDPTEDGLLQTHEILKLDLSADLVTLSACNTGLGRIAGGEGVLGLTRAFLHAGARSVLISLWEVADHSTVELMDDFYDAYVVKGLPLDAALQAAQIAAIARGGSPREWAPFVLIGSPDVVPREVKGAPTWLLLIGIVIGCGVLAWALRRRAAPS